MANPFEVNPAADQQSRDIIDRIDKVLENTALLQQELGYLRHAYSAIYQDVMLIRQSLNGVANETGLARDKIRRVRSVLVSHLWESARIQVINAAEIQALRRRVHELEGHCVKPFPLMRLPQEIRLNIYRYVFPNRRDARIRVLRTCGPKHKHSLHVDTAAQEDDSHKFYGFQIVTAPGVSKSEYLGCCKLPGTPPIIRGDSLLALLHVSRHVYSEAMPVFYRESHFFFNCATQCFAFLKSLVPERRNFIRHVSIDLMTVPTPSAVALLRAATTELPDPTFAESTAKLFAAITGSLELLAQTTSFRTLEIMLCQHAQMRIIGLSLSNARLNNNNNNSVPPNPLTSRLEDFLEVQCDADFEFVRVFKAASPKTKIRWIESLEETWKPSRPFMEMMQYTWEARSVDTNGRLNIFTPNDFGVDSEMELEVYDMTHRSY